MTDLDVRTDALDAAAASLARANAAIARELADLEAASRQLAGGWTGEAQLAYAEAHAAWHGSLAVMRGLLGSATSALRESSDGYADTERRVAELWKIG